MNFGKKGTDYVLEQEKNAQELIEEAYKEKDEIVKKAKEVASKQLITYDEEKRQQHNDRVTELNSNRNYIEEIESRNIHEIKEVEKQFNKNMSNVVDYLFNNVITVKYEIPEVIKGKIEEKISQVTIHN